MARFKARLGALAAILAAAAPTAAAAACNLGQDAPSITALSFGKIRLSGFEAGALHVSGAEANSDGDSWAFRLSPASNEVILAVTPKVTPGLRLGGTLHLTRPITGHIIERIVGGSCSRTLVIDTGVLTGATLHASQTVLNTRTGSRTDDMTGKTLQVQAQLPISDSATRTVGTLRLIAPQVALGKARVRLGASDGPAYITRLQSAGPVVLDFDVNLLAADFREGVFSGGKWSVPSPSKVLVASLKVDASQLAGAQTSVTYKGGAVAIRAAGASISYSRLELSPGFHVATAAPGVISGAAFSGAGDPGAADALVVPPASLTLESAAASLAKATFELPGGGSATGAARLALITLSAKRTDVKATLAAPAINAFFPSSLKVTPKQMVLAAAGPSSGPSVSAQLQATALAFGSAGLTAADLPLRIAFAADGDAVVSLAPAAAATLSVGQTPALLSAKTSDLVFSAATPAALGGGERTMTIAPGSFKGHLALAQQIQPRLGGQLVVPAATFAAANPAEMRLDAAVTGALLDMGVATVVLKDPQIEPSPGGAPLTLAGSTASKGAPVSLSVAAVDPGLKVRADFDLPGFDLKPPPPITSIKVTVGGFDVDVTGLKLGGVHIGLDLKETTVTLKELSLGLGKFAPHPAGDGEPEPALNLSGEASVPLSVGATTGTFPLSALPIRMSKLDVAKLHFEAKALDYSGPGNLRVRPARAVIDVASLELPQAPGAKPKIAATLALSDMPLSWTAAPSGAATVESLLVTLAGDPAEPDGSLAVVVRNLSLDGRADIPLGTNPDGNHGCNLTVPADMSMTAALVEGTVALEKGKPKGVLNASGFNTGHIKYIGHQDCRWEQLVKLGSVTIYWPCFGTITDPARTCSKTVEPSFTIGMVFAVKAVDMYIEPKEVKFKFKDDGGVEACHISLSRIYSVVAPLYSISPQFPVGGDIGKAINDLVSVGVGAMESSFTGGALDIYSAMNLFGFGEANPVKDKCS